MNSRRNFLKASGALAIGSMLLPEFADAANRKCLKRCRAAVIYCA